MVLDVRFFASSFVPGQRPLQEASRGCSVAAFSRRCVPPLLLSAAFRVGVHYMLGCQPDLYKFC
jgi:hypothetical protein